MVSGLVVHPGYKVVGISVLAQNIQIIKLRNERSKYSDVKCENNVLALQLLNGRCTESRQTEKGLLE